MDLAARVGPREQVQEVEERRRASRAGGIQIETWFGILSRQALARDAELVGDHDVRRSLGRSPPFS